MVKSKIKGTHPLAQLMLGGEDADLVSGSFLGLPPDNDNGRVLPEHAAAAAPLLSRNPVGEATAGAFFAGSGERVKPAPGSFCGTAAAAAAAAADGSESLARLRCSLCWRCCCFSSMGLKRRLGLLPLPLPPPAIPGDDLAAALSACWPFLLLSFESSVGANRGPAPFSVALLSGAGCCCCTACSASSPLLYTIVGAAVREDSAPFITLEGEGACSSLQERDRYGNLYNLHTPSLLESVFCTLWTPPCSLTPKRNARNQEEKKISQIQNGAPYLYFLTPLPRKVWKRGVVGRTCLCFFTGGDPRDKTGDE